MPEDGGEVGSPVDVGGKGHHFGLTSTRHVMQDFSELGFATKGTSESPTSTLMFDIEPRTEGAVPFEFVVVEVRRFGVVVEVVDEGLEALVD